jgi:hypothetical protein
MNRAQIVDKLNELLAVEEECYPLYLDEALETMGDDPTQAEVDAIEQRCRENRDKYAEYADEIQDLLVEYFSDYGETPVFNAATNRYHVPVPRRAKQ